MLKRYKNIRNNLKIQILALFYALIAIKIKHSTQFLQLLEIFVINNV